MRSAFSRITIPVLVPYPQIRPKSETGPSMDVSRKFYHSNIFLLLIFLLLVMPSVPTHALSLNVSISLLESPSKVALLNARLQVSLSPVSSSVKNAVRTISWS